MKKTYSNHNHTPCHPEASAEGSGHKTTVSLRFFTTFRMTVCLSSSGLTAAVLACLLLTTPTQAKWGDNCTLNDGTIIKANEYGNDKGGYCNDPTNDEITEKDNCNGMEFCMSNNVMNWWSAFTWCESVGGKLASFEHVCPGSQKLGGQKCYNIAGISGSPWAWTASGLSNNFSLFFGDFAWQNLG